MDIYEKLKNKFTSREQINCTVTVLFNEPPLVEQMKSENLDFIVFDMEHGRYDTQNLIPCLHMCRTAGIPSVVRVQDTAYHLIAKTIDMGADGIMLPRTETLEQLGTAIDAMRFFPVGKKGWGGLGQFRKGESMDEFQKGRYLIPQIESPKGIENLPKMLDDYADEISAIIVGPYDMSVMLGTPQDLCSEPMKAAINKVASICAEYKKSFGVYCNNLDEARMYHKVGANVAWIGTDLGFFMDGYNNVFGSALDFE